MERISTFNMQADMATLQSALATGSLPDAFGGPLQALVKRITDAAANQPLALYVSSPDEDAGARDHFAYLLARTLLQHIPSTLLVDCDFLDVGLHGLVPEADALGFLDLLLYGSSIGVITQQATGGVRTVGAGSFPVTKRMPFVLGAFEDASRRLVNHARVVVFVGPLFDEESELHPLLGAVEVPVLVRELEMSRGDAVDPVEERIASTWDTEVTSVRLVSPRAGIPVDETFSRVLGDEDDEVAAPTPEPPPPPPPPAPVERPTEATFAELADTSAEDQDEVLNVPPPSEPVTEPEPPAAIEGPAPWQPSEPAPPPPFAGPDKRGDQKRGRRAVPVAVVVALIAVAASIWWIDRNRTEPPGGAETTVAEPAKPVSDAEATRGGNAEPTPPPPVAAADTAEAVPVEEPEVAAKDVPSGVVERVIEEPRYVDPADTGGRSGGTVLLNSHDIHVMEDLERNWPDAYFIHISSFRRSVEARDEVAYLESREFPVFIVFLDLDAKGKWYRVYAGPFTTRDEAREVKKSLDDIPRVRFTRITKISD